MKSYAKREDAMAPTVILTDSSNDDDGAKGMAAGQTQKGASSPKVANSSGDEDHGDLRKIFAAHIKAKTKDIADELWSLFKIKCLTPIINFQEHSTRK